MGRLNQVRHLQHYPFQGVVIQMYQPQKNTFYHLNLHVKANPQEL